MVTTGWRLRCGFARTVAFALLLSYSYSVRTFLDLYPYRRQLLVEYRSLRQGPRNLEQEEEHVSYAIAFNFHLQPLFHARIARLFTDFPQMISHHV